MQLYIDSNIYLEYFRENSAERLTPLKELVKLIEDKKIKLLLPSQTRQEYFRNRRKIAEITRTALIRQGNVSSVIPAVIDKENKEVKDVLNSTKGLVRAYKKLIEKYDKEVEKEKTDADLLINKLFFKYAREIKETDQIVSSAYKRYMKGNPPRKNDHSYGDAIIWETLLKEGENDDLVLITKDSDYIEIFKGKPIINHFLFVEWRVKTKKKKRVVLYKSLAEFVNNLTKKQIIKKEIVQQENSLIFSPIITKGLSYEIQGPTGPTGPRGTFDITTVSGHPSSIIGITTLNNNPTLINPEYNNLIANSGILRIPTQDTISLNNRKCIVCGNELPYNGLSISPVYCTICGTFNH
ncbi:MAG: PIN domain-containing protein [Candidatus Paceibacterota bacterium]|jgi:predicted nucleic acid-binding protein